MKKSQRCFPLMWLVATYEALNSRGSDNNDNSDEHGWMVRYFYSVHPYDKYKNVPGWFA